MTARDSISIVWDGFWYVAGPPSQRHVVRETISEWARSFPQDELTIVVQRKHYEKAVEDAPPGAKIVPSRLWPQALLATRACASVAAKQGADVVYTQNFAARAPGRLSVVFIHDMLFQDHPEWFTFKERLYFQGMPRTAPRADLVIASTQSEAERMVRRSPITEAQVVSVGIGLPEELRSAVPDDSLAVTHNVQPGKFLLAVGRLNVRKNLATLLEAVLDSAIVSPDFPLVIIGAPNGRDEVIGERGSQATADRSVIFTGQVSDSVLKWFYQNCAVFIFPSLGEGFGMPPVEAAAFGAKLVVNDLPVFRETLRGCDVSYVDCTDANLLRHAIVSARDADDGPSTEFLPPDWRSVVSESRHAILTGMG